MDIELFRQNPNFDQAVGAALRDGLTLARAIRTVARLFRDNGVRLPNYQIQNTRSRFESNLLEGPRKRDREGRIKDIDQVQKKLDFEDPAAAIMTYNDDVNFKRSKMTLGRVKKRSANDVFKATIGNMTETIYRWQSCSSNLLGPGKNIIGFGINTAETNGNFKRVVPFHMMSLTHHPDFTDNLQLGCINRGMFRFVNAWSGQYAGHFGYQFLGSTLSNGSPATGSWHLEKGISSEAISQVFHKWTDVRLNLYGSTLYPLKYRVRVVKGMPTEMQPLEYEAWQSGGGLPVAAADVPIFETTPLNEFILDSVRPLVSNPIIGSNSDETYKGKVKVVSDKTYVLPCMSYGTAAAEGASTINATNVRSVNMFIRHDRFRDYQWSSMPADKAMNNDLGGVGWTTTDANQTTIGSMLSDVDREERMFLIITCTAPALENAPIYSVSSTVVPGLADSVAARETTGTYDIVVRNCFRDGTKV